MSASPGSSVEQEIIAREREFNDVIKTRNVEAARAIQASGYRLLVRAEGSKLLEMTQEQWLSQLPNYMIDSHATDDIKVLVLGDVAVASLAHRQTGHFAGSPRNISGEFMLTDIWVKRDGQWKIIERHSSRAEKPTA